MIGRQHNKLQTFAAFFAIYIVWGTTYLAIKHAVETIPPFLMMGMRSLSAGMVLYTWGRLRGDANVTRKELPSLFLIGILFFLIGHGVLAWAQKTVPSGVAALLVASEPIIIALFEPLFTREGRIGKRTLLGMLIGVGGIAVLVLPQGFDFKNANLLSSFGILVAAGSWASGAIYTRVAKLPRSPLITGGLQLLFGGAFLILASFLLGEWSAFTLSQVTVRSWLGLVYLVVFGSILAFSAYTWLLTITSATRISTHTFINPVVAMLVGWAIGGEALTVGMLIATVLIVISVYLILIRKSATAKDTIEEAAVAGAAGEP
ncbi:MAG: EamA family transporter [Bacteroidales bacterium]|nr:EamA family transporter [Bacteroidales bacterium]